MMRMVYRECREPVEEPELYSGEDGGMPLHYRVYLLIRELWSMRSGFVAGGGCGGEILYE